MLDVQMTLQAQERMENARSAFEGQWQQAAELFLPRQADFYNGYSRQQGEDRANLIFDEYGTQAVDDGTSVFEGMVMPRGSMWQLIVPPNDELAELQNVAAWFEAKTNRLHELRNHALSGFVTESNESAASLLVFGNQAMEVELRHDPMIKRPIGLRYRSEFLGRVYWEDDWQGLPCRKHVKFKMSARDALDRFGAAALDRAPQVAGKAADPKKAGEHNEWLRVIVPNPSVQPGRLDAAGKPWLCGFLSIADREFVEIGGYRSSPLTVSRFRKSPTETYGRGPGTDLLPAIKAAQAIMIDLMVAAEMGLIPPLGAPDDATDILVNYAAGEITYGAIDGRGNQLIKELFTVGEMQGAQAIQQLVHAAIDRGFFRNLLALSQDLKSHVTDSQIYERTQEKGILLSPMARQESEWFTPMLDREIDLMAQMGEFDDMPGEVREAGGMKAVAYDNPLNRALRAEQAGGYFRALNQVVSVAQYDQSALTEFFREYPLAKAIRGIGDIEAIPASWRATDAEKAAFDQVQAQKAAQMQAQTFAQAAPQLARAAKDYSDATADAA